MHRFWRPLAVGLTAVLVAWGGATGAAAQDMPRRQMPADPRLDQLTFLTTHNAMANSDEGFPFFRFPNQSYRLRDQLRHHHVRGLQLDVHPYRGEVRMCHGTCWGNERTLRAGLQDVVDFLTDDRRAVVTVFLEDYTTPEQLAAELGRVDGLGQVLLRPDQQGVREHGWPTLSQLEADGRRLLIFSQRPGREAAGVMYDRDWTAENFWSLGGAGDRVGCVSRWDEVPLDRQEPRFRRLFVMNHYRDVPTEFTAATDNAAKLRDRIDRQCGPAAGRKPNFVALDFVQKPDGGAVGRLITELNGFW